MCVYPLAKASLAEARRGLRSRIAYVLRGYARGSTANVSKLKTGDATPPTWMSGIDGCRGDEARA
jgi:hypothetical protein